MMDDAPRFLLFQRDDCHLCDLALAVLAEARLPGFESIFIDGDDGLEAAYGSRVPVLRDAAKDNELDWPFDVASVAALHAGYSLDGHHDGGTGDGGLKCG